MLVADFRRVVVVLGQHHAPFVRTRWSGKFAHNRSTQHPTVSVTGEPLADWKSLFRGRRLDVINAESTHQTDERSARPSEERPRAASDVQDRVLEDDPCVGRSGDRPRGGRHRVAQPGPVRFAPGYLAKDCANTVKRAWRQAIPASGPGRTSTTGRSIGWSGRRPSSRRSSGSHGKS